MIEVAATEPPGVLDEGAEAAVVGAVAALDLVAAADLARGGGARRLVVAVEPATPAHDEAAAGAGFEVVREILQLRCPLPVDLPWELVTRPFRPGLDEEAWLEVNNRAFAWHPDQSGQTLEQLRAQEAEPWFDPDGFLLHEAVGPDGTPRLAGFCWTKVHAGTDPPMGEIYVIGVDPNFQGRGLGRPLTLAGLGWLADRGLEVGMLYVEADNVPARRLYDHIGFHLHQAQRRYAITLSP